MHWSAAGCLALAAALVFATMLRPPLPAVADGPVSDQASITGRIPRPGQAGTLSTESMSTATLMETLGNHSCVPATLAVASGTQWIVAAKGAPPSVNASFPLTISGDFFVRCASAPGANFTLTLLHNNDGESQLLGLDDPDYGGIARFKTLAGELRFDATMNVVGPSAALMVSAGDNFLAGPELNASFAAGTRIYDGVGLDAVGYDVMALGNHEFDFGPDVLADFINSFSGGNDWFVTANLDFSAEPELQAMVDSGTIVPSLVFEKSGRRIGIVGATTPDLVFDSSPRGVVIDPDVAATVQDQIDALEEQGVSIIILVSHLQGLTQDRELVAQLHSVDIAVAGGGDELLAGPDALLVPGDEQLIEGTYPTLIKNADGADVPVVTTKGAYSYIGRLIATFDAGGKLVSVDADSGPVRVSGVGADAVVADPGVLTSVVQPVGAFIDDLGQTVIGATAVALDGRRNPGVRTQETNEGDLMADALLWQAQQAAADFEVASPQVAIQNGGGIRNDAIIPAGDLTVLTTFDIAPFSSFVSVVPDLTPVEFKALMENAVCQVEQAAGRFAQVAGFAFVYDPSRTPRIYDEDGNVSAEGSRVVSIVLEDGTEIVKDGSIVAGAPNVSLATIDFLARGGDQYPLAQKTFTTIGVTYQQALENYITIGLDGTLSGTEYPEGGSGRIVAQ